MAFRCTYYPLYKTSDQCIDEIQLPVFNALDEHAVEIIKKLTRKLLLFCGWIHQT